jgi:methionyl-tRNA formyltransferase
MSDTPARNAVVLGKGDLAIRVASWFRAADDYELVGVIPVVPEPTWTGSLVEWARANSVAAVASGDFRNLAAIIGDVPVDIAFSVFYDHILDEEFIESCGRVLNLHNSPLPRYRGVSPINWALRNEEPSHGVTIHEITPGIDSGPIVAQLEYSIYPEIDEVEDVYRRALAYGWTLFEQTMPLLDRLTPRPQDESQATYYPASRNGELGDRRGFTRTAQVDR